MKKILISCILLAAFAGFVIADGLDEALSGNTFSAASQNAVQGQADKVIAGLSMWALIWGLIFNGVGVFAFLYGKKKQSVPFMIIGVLLIGYPYVVQNAVSIFIIGVVLSGALYFFRGE
jgi:hypothetical protein